MDLRSKLFLAAAAALGVSVTACGGGSHASETPATTGSTTSGSTATTGESSCGAAQGSGSCGADEGSGSAQHGDAGMGDMPMGSTTSSTTPH